MRLLDTILGSIGLGDKTTQEIAGLLEWVEQQGGIQSIVSRFRDGECSDIVSSWLHDDKNISVSVECIQSIFSSTEIKQLANKLGINMDDTSSLLAKYLPQLVDLSSANGEVNDTKNLASILSALKH